MLDALNHESLATFLHHHWLMVWFFYWLYVGPFLSLTVSGR